MTFEEKTIQSEMIYQGKILNLRKDQVLAVHGGISEREIVEHTGGVVMAAVLPEGQMIMIRQFRKAVEQVVFEAPAGKLEEKEGLFEAAFRELKEETGYHAKSIESMGTYFSSCGYTTEKLHLFLLRDLTPGETSFDDNEAIEVEKWPLEQLREMVVKGEIVDAKTALIILLAYEKTR
jgi:ADP-ribose pyrophosphatase